MQTEHNSTQIQKQTISNLQKSFKEDLNGRNYLNLGVSDGEFKRCMYHSKLDKTFSHLCL